MKNLLLIPFLILCLLSSGCEDADIMLVADAGIDAVKAITLNDEAVQEMAVQASQHADSSNSVAPQSNPYAQRLARLTNAHLQQDAMRFNFKVYLAPEVNAFAMADGTIRIYSGLMDMMDDGELLFVIGHEMGHVVNDHIRKKMRLAYAARAVRKGAASLRNEVGLIAGSQIGGFVERLLNARFSQQEEREADDYGLLYMQQTSHNPQSAVAALEKLATLGNNHSFLSSHPAPGKRAERLRVQL